MNGGMVNGGMMVDGGMNCERGGWVERRQMIMQSEKQNGKDRITKGIGKGYGRTGESKIGKDGGWNGKGKQEWRGMKK